MADHPLSEVPIMPTVNPVGSSAMNDALRDFIAHAVAEQRARQDALRVDGTIIGTGEADFTKGNHIYRLRIDNKPFQLVDVPGIEGNETLYGGYVDEAIASAHMVFYVNGTNKKPEVATLSRIRRYLHRGTTLCPLLNVRGFADAYEFDEDRISLAENKEAGRALAETVTTLEKEFDPALLQKGLCVQGLLAFSALAIDRATGQSTIHPERAKDLGRVQTRYLDTFESAGDMLRFSGIQALADVLSTKTRTFKQDIVESNKRKVLQLVSATRLALQSKIDLWHKRLRDDAPTFATCYMTITHVGNAFVKAAAKQRQIVWHAFFQNLQIEADTLIARHFGDAEAIRSQLEQRQEALLAAVEIQWSEWIANAARQLDDDLARATTRLAEDLVQTDMQLHLAENLGEMQTFDISDLSMDLSLKDLGGFAVDIGAYALSGAAIGTAFPVIGNMIGLIAGAAVGLVKAAVTYFVGKGDRIRTAQQTLHRQIARTSAARLEALKTSDLALGADVTRAIDAAVTSRVKAVEENLAKVPLILEKQCAALTLIQNKVEDMPHGSIHAIRD